MTSYDCSPPVSRTYQYKKITKPLLERKRRARINRCLEELKELMVDALEMAGENISKLEKADVLELTVHHLQSLQASRPSGLSSVIAPNEDKIAESRWQSGFGECATAACNYLASLPDPSGEQLARHLASTLQAAWNINIQFASRPELMSPMLLSPNQYTNSIDSHDMLMDMPSSSLSPSSSVASQFVGLTMMSPVYSEVSYDSDHQLLMNSEIERTNLSNESNQTNSNEEEEEIDVELVDHWRPW